MLFCALLVVVLGSSQYAYSKGSPDKIIIKGNSLRQPIEITDRAMLKGFDPWSGQFIDWPGGIVASQPAADATYEVSFYIKWKPTDRHRRGDCFMYSDTSPAEMVNAAMCIFQARATSGDP